MGHIVAVPGPFSDRGVEPDVHGVDAE